MDVTIGDKPAPSLEEHLVGELLRERRRDRRWRVIRFFLLFGTFVGIAALLVVAGRPSDDVASRPGDRYVAVVRMEGTIAPSEGISAGASIPCWPMRSRTVRLRASWW